MGFERWLNGNGMVPVERDEVDSHSEIDLNRLPDGAMILITTQQWHYVLQKRTGSQVYLAGHPGLSPVPIPVELSIPEIDGRRLLACGMCLEFDAPNVGHVKSSPIRSLRPLVCAPLVRRSVRPEGKRRAKWISTPPLGSSVLAPS